MIYCDENCLDMPDDFPAEEYTNLMAVARRTLLNPKGVEWREFGGASNLIGWRYRAATEDWLSYKSSWDTHGPSVGLEGIYGREKMLFGMFTAGVSCIEAAVYALAAMLSHKDIAGIAFGEKERKNCGPSRLRSKLSGQDRAANLHSVLVELCESDEWEMWLSLRNRMVHRSWLPRVSRAAVGESPPPAQALDFGETTSTPAIRGDLSEFDSLHSWLTSTLTKLLVEGASLCPLESN